MISYAHEVWLRSKVYFQVLREERRDQASPIDHGSPTAHLNDDNMLTVAFKFIVAVLTSAWRVLCFYMEDHITVYFFLRSCSLCGEYRCGVCNLAMRPRVMLKDLWVSPRCLEFP